MHAILLLGTPTDTSIWGEHSCCTCTGHCHIICTDGCTMDSTCGAGYFCDTAVTQLCLPKVGKGAPCVEVRLKTNFINE